MVLVNVLIDEVKHEDQVVLNRPARKATKLVQVNMVVYVGPYPLNEEPFQSFAEEGGKAKIS